MPPTGRTATRPGVWTRLSPIFCLCYATCPLVGPIFCLYYATRPLGGANKSVQQLASALLLLLVVFKLLILVLLRYLLTWVFDFIPDIV